jgi:large subunit ribosomal protein L6
MHRALLANKVKGAETGFEKKIKIVGLGYKAQLAGKKLTFSLGYSHKIDYELPEGVDVKLDKTGQNLVFSSSNKLLLGDVCSHIRKLRPPEPYKGTGIIVGDEVIIRKAGKTKAAA